MEFSAQGKKMFKHLLDDLRSKKGRGTELISLYIPPDKQISDVTAQLRKEYGQAADIKSRVTRLSVQGSLESAIVSDLSRLADASGAEIEVISTEFEMGAQLYKALGGAAAILRYKTSHLSGR